MNAKTRFLLACTVVFAFHACNGEPGPESRLPPLPSRLTWEGQFPAAIHTDSAFPAGSPEHQTEILKIHSLEFPHSTKVRILLREYSKDYLAYHAFQARASAEELKEGVYRDKNSLFFFHGAFLGELRPEGNTLVPVSFLKEKLAFHPEEPFKRPRAFLSFPIGGQIPYSERVVTAGFLGRVGADNVLVMAYECHEDTAYLFRGIPPFNEDPKSWIQAWKGHSDTSRWSGEVRFSGRMDPGQPLIFWNFKGGFVGVLGCFDPQLALGYAEKLKKMGVLLQKP